MSDPLNEMWAFLNERQDAADRRQRRQTLLSEIAGVTSTFEIMTLADAPLAADGMLAYEVRFISDGRKQGEGAGNGTGVPAYYDPAQDAWLRLSDDTAVAT